MTTTTTKFVYFFGNGQAEGRGIDKEILGGKGAGLAEMTAIGIPVPPGFTISTIACKDYFENGNSWPPTLRDEIAQAVAKLEDLMGQRLGEGDKPLLVSVRSGAAQSMPGMMDTILNLGLTDDSVEALARATNNPRMAYDSYRRLIEMFGGVVKGAPRHHFESEMDRLKERVGVTDDVQLSADHLRDLVGQYKIVYEREIGEPFPQEPRKQLHWAIEAVFKSWNNERAIAYRLRNRLSGLGTGVNVQSMVFGNFGETSGTGVGFTRNPATGDKEPLGEYLFNAQGEDVVAGIRTPLKIIELQSRQPEVYQQIHDTFQILEKHYKDMQDVEFTVQEGKLFFLQTRSGKRTAFAAVKIACDMVDEGLVTPQEALKRIPADDMPQLFAPRFDEAKVKETRNANRKLATGIPAGPGAASGHAVFTPADAVVMAKLDANGHPTVPVILCRRETSPEDIKGMFASAGILTSRGGTTSHAAVVARGEGIPCIVGCGALHIDEHAKQMRVAGQTINHGDFISFDGMTGEVFSGQIATEPSEVEQVLSGKLDPTSSDLFQLYSRVMAWADETRKLRVRTNSDTAQNCREARMYGAEGIGLCRTEHMFFDKERISAVRQMILADTERDRYDAIMKVKPFQKADFKAIFEVMSGLPCTIRLLDPPLHEFLPHNDELIAELAQITGKTTEQIATRISALHETNPMLGHRGCRLGITFPVIYDMQVEAIIEAACEIKDETGNPVVPEIMIPLVAWDSELRMLRQRAIDVANRVLKNRNTTLDYLVGTMIEIPRAALTADQVAEYADFFSFGTNDLTQCTLGISRDDSGHFLPEYKDLGVIREDPFATLDQTGVGRLVELATQSGRKTKPTLKVGICGEHGGDAQSVVFFHKVGLDYVSCSPRRIPVARLAAAQAQLGLPRP